MTKTMAAAPSGSFRTAAVFQKGMLRRDAQQYETYHTSAQPCKASAGAGTADGTASVVYLALDTEAGWYLAKAALHGDTA